MSNTPPNNSAAPPRPGADSVSRYIGLEITERSPDRVVAEWTVTPAHHQPFGIVHGGIHAAVTESLGSIAAGGWAREKGYGRIVGVNNSTDFYRPVSEGRLVSVCEPIHRGRTQQVWCIETRDAQGRLIARGQLRLQNIPAS
jgi:uncharacterized protein (TIGR00369 family)